MSERAKPTFLEAPIETIDGDRGVNYPKLADFASDGYCLFLNAINVSSTGFNFSKCSFISEECDNLLRKGKLERYDSVLTTRGTVGNVAFYDNSISFSHVRINSGMVIFRPDQTAIVPRYLYIFLRSILFKNQVSALTTGSAQPQLPIRDIYRIHISLPSISEQNNIAETIGALDDKIELNRRMNTTLEGMARALFRDWFVDFGPTRAKMAGADPYLAAEIWSLFPDRLDEGGIPKGWEISEIGKETTVVGGSTPSTKEPSYWGGGNNWTTPKDLSALKSPVLLETNRTITEAGLEKISSGLLPAGTVLLSSRAPVGYIAISAIPVAVNQGYIAMRCNARLSNVYVWLWLHENMEAIKGNANGSTFQEISKKNFRPLSVTVPLDGVMRAFNEIVSPIYERIEKNEIESRTLAQTRDLLLPRLMSGEIRVREAEQIAEGMQ